MIFKPLYFWRVSCWGGRVCTGRICDHPMKAYLLGLVIPNQIPSRIVGDNHGQSWNPASLAQDILSFIGILLFVGLKATYVFFSWLNYFLLASGLNVVGISLLVFAIGFMMFMLPIVPGTAVYLFSGVVSWRLWWLVCVGGTENICKLIRLQVKIRGPDQPPKPTGDPDLPIQAWTSCFILFGVVDLDPLLYFAVNILGPAPSLPL